MRAGPSNASSPASALIWLTTPPTTVSRRPQGNASTHTSSPSLAISLRFTAGSTMPSATSSVTSASGLDATTTSFVRSLRPGVVRWICWVVGGSRKWRAVTIHERRVTASEATTTPEADRRPPPSRSHRSWTVDGRIFRMTSSRVVSEPLEAHPVARRVRTATPRASLMPAHSDREHPGRQILSSRYRSTSMAAPLGSRRPEPGFETSVLTNSAGPPVRVSIRSTRRRFGRRAADAATDARDERDAVIHAVVASHSSASPKSSGGIAAIAHKLNTTSRPRRTLFSNRRHFDELSPIALTTSEVDEFRPAFGDANRVFRVSIPLRLRNEFPQSGHLGESRGQNQAAFGGATRTWGGGTTKPLLLTGR